VLEVSLIAYACRDYESVSSRAAARTILPIIGDVVSFASAVVRSHAPLAAENLTILKTPVRSPASERVLRTTDWHDSARLLGLADFVQRGSPLTRPRAVGRVLQSRASAHERQPRIPDAPDLAPSAAWPSDSRRPRSSCQVDSRRSSSRVPSRTTGCVCYMGRRDYLRTTSHSSLNGMSNQPSTRTTLIVATDSRSVVTTSRRALG
jgi:hypothetical protein